MDFLLELSKNPAARSIVKGLGLPVPQPPVLERARSAWRQRILNDQTAVVHGNERSELLGPLAETLAASGARVVFSGPQAAARSFTAPAEAWAEPLALRSAPAADERVHALVLDLSGVTTLGDLSELFHATAPWLPALRGGGRVIVLGRPASEALEPETAAVRQALEGFVRSLAKETGRKGISCNLLWVTTGAEARAAGPLRYFLSSYSAFVTAQPLAITNHVRANAKSPAELPLFGRVAVVTGAAQGIGAATARALGREGAKVVIVDRPEADADASRLAQDLGGTFLLLDVASADAPEALAQHLRPLGGAHLVVHNAGVTRDKTLSRMSEEQWALVLDINLRAVVRATEHLLGQNLLADEGRLVFLSSVGGIAGNPGQTNYAASKAGLIGYARALAPRLAPRGITVNAIAPGLIETKMTARMPLAIREAARRLSALNQGGLPQDVAEAITFLSLPSSDGVTGAVLRVCGGALVGA